MLAGYDILYGHNRCAWLKARRINRFRAFLSPDFFVPQMQRALSSRVTGFKPVIALSWPGIPPFPAKEAADEAEIPAFLQK